jgi:hypothetical protein
VSSPPVKLEDFNYRNKSHLESCYNHFKSYLKLSAWCGVDASTLQLWGRTRFGIPIAQECYRNRGGMFGGAPESTERPEPTPEPDSSALLLEYIKNRTPPTGVPARAHSSSKRYAVELIGGDLQYPFHHEAAWEVFLGLAEKMQPDGVTLNGDTYDFHYLSRFRQDPRVRADMQADIDECRELLTRVNACAPRALKRMTVGNHDLDRFMAYLMERVPALMTLRALMAFDAILGLPEVGWELVTEGYWLIDKVLRVSHGTAVTNTQGGGSGQSAKKEMLMWGCAGVTGHSHKLGAFYRVDPISYRVWHEGGCLCDQKKMRAAGVNTHKPYGTCEDWHLGCVRVDYSLEGESYIITDIPILESKGRTFAIWQDEEVVA